MYTMNRNIKIAVAGATGRMGHDKIDHFVFLAIMRNQRDIQHAAVLLSIVHQMLESVHHTGYGHDFLDCGIDARHIPGAIE